MNRISDRIEALRRFMQTKGISAFIVPSTDPHSGEYVPAHWESRKWISGFTGSAGTAVITMSQGGIMDRLPLFFTSRRTTSRKRTNFIQRPASGNSFHCRLVREHIETWRKSRY